MTVGKKRLGDRGRGLDRPDIRPLAGVEPKPQRGLQCVELGSPLAVLEKLAEGYENSGGDLLECRATYQATPRGFRGVGEAARSAPHGAIGKPSRNRKREPPKHARAEREQAELPSLERGVGSEAKRHRKTKSRRDDQRHTETPQRAPSRIEPGEVPEPEQRSDAKLDRGGEHAVERTEPGVRKPHGEAGQCDPRQAALHHMSSVDKHDLVKGARRQNPEDDHDRERHFRKQALSRQGSPDERSDARAPRAPYRTSEPVSRGKTRSSIVSAASSQAMS